MSSCRSVSATTSLPQPGALAAARLTGRSSLLKEGWALVEATLAAIFVISVVTGQSLGCRRSSAFSGKSPPRAGPGNLPQVGSVGCGVPQENATDIQERLESPPGARIEPD